MSIEQKIADILAESNASTSTADDLLEETLDEGSMSKMSLSQLHARHAKHFDNEWNHPKGGGDGSEYDAMVDPARTEKQNHAAKAIEKHVQKKYGSAEMRKMVRKNKTSLYKTFPQEDYDMDQFLDNYFSEEQQEGHLTTDGVTSVADDNESSKKNNVDKQEIGGKSKTANVVTKDAAAPEASHLKSMKEDIEALTAGEDLTEEFKEKAATIFEAAVMNRVKQEVAKLDEAYESKLMEEVEQIKEGLVEKVDGYLDYVVEQWMEQNEIALESGMKSDILESFVGGMKSLFEEHYIDIPEEKFDVLGSLEEQVSGLTEKLDEQFEANVNLKSELAQYQVKQVVAELSEGLVETDKEKFHALVEELEFDGVETFAKKAQTIRESYFTNKVTATSGKGSSVVTDSPVALTEEKYVAPQMKSYLSILDNLK